MKTTSTISVAPQWWMPRISQPKATPVMMYWMLS